ncbi:3726_t:CDS:2 [Dentiscutata erythropus]|uniref:3726_t:CDS:1 n=1 Tax=Dentiscutata erythropus TaxID=1348616 RepID=A0A9N9F191_9GLOM|nr:3726_t:CDS:2 [Dentiscutata erythropus]
MFMERVSELWAKYQTSPLMCNKERSFVVLRLSGVKPRYLQRAMVNQLVLIIYCYPLPTVTCVEDTIYDHCNKLSEEVLLHSWIIDLEDLDAKKLFTEIHHALDPFSSLETSTNDNIPN